LIGGLSAQTKDVRSCRNRERFRTDAVNAVKENHPLLSSPVQRPRQSELVIDPNPESGFFELMLHTNFNSRRRDDDLFRQILGRNRA